MDRGDKIFLGAVAGVVVGAGVATTRRRRRSEMAELERIDPDLIAERERRPQFLDTPCEQCGVNAGVRERKGTRLEPRVVHGGLLPVPVLQDHRIFFTYHACRNCGAVR